MRAWFLVVAGLAYLGLSLWPLLTLAFDGLDDPSDAVLLVVGTQVLAVAVFLRAAQQVSFVEHDPELRRRTAERWGRGTLVGVVVGTATSAIGLSAVVPPVPATVASILLVAVVTGLVPALDRYAAHVAARRPPSRSDVDDPRLEPRAVRSRLRRASQLGLGGGVVAAVVVAALVTGVESIDVSPVVAAATAAVIVTVLVGFAPVVPLAWSANRRLDEVTGGDDDRARRIRGAVMRRETSGLPDHDRDLAPRWAAAAETALLLQTVQMAPALLLLPGLYVGQALLGDGGPPGLLITVWLLAALGAWVDVVRRWRRVATFTAPY